MSRAGHASGPPMETRARSRRRRRSNVTIQLARLPARLPDRLRDLAARVRAGLHRDLGRTGRWSSAITSPTTLISGWPATMRSGCTGTRPCRSGSTPGARASVITNGTASTPAVQSTVRASYRDVEPSSAVVASPVSSTSVTCTPIMVSTPRRRSVRSARRASPFPKDFSTTSPPSKSRTRASSVSIRLDVAVPVPQAAQRHRDLPFGQQTRGALGTPPSRPAPLAGPPLPQRALRLR
jgi:hypothetical protein